MFYRMTRELCRAGDDLGIARDGDAALSSPWKTMSVWTRVSAFRAPYSDTWMRHLATNRTKVSRR